MTRAGALWRLNWAEHPRWSLHASVHCLAEMAARWVSFCLLVRHSQGWLGSLTAWWSQHIDFLHDSWSLPEHVFMKLRQKLGFLCPCLRSHTRSLPLTSITYTGQRKFNAWMAYTTVWMLRSEGHWEAILKTGYHNFPVSRLLCAPMGPMYSPSSASLSHGTMHAFFFCFPAPLWVPLIGWLVLSL